MLAEIFGPDILPTMFHNSKSPDTEPTGTLSATVRGHCNGKHCLFLLSEGEKEQEQ